MHEYMASRGDEVLVNSTEEGVERVRTGRGGYAFILGSYQDIVFIDSRFLNLSLLFRARRSFLF